MLSPTRAGPWFLQAQEAEALYQGCVREANARQQDLEAAKQRIVSHIRKLVLQGDEVMRRVRPFSPPPSALSWFGTQLSAARMIGRSSDQPLPSSLSHLPLPDLAPKL